jgi:MFS family permease
VWGLALQRLCVVAGFSASMAYFALYLHGEMGIPMETVGLLVMVASLTGAPSQVVAGELSDRLGRRPLIVAPLFLRAGIFTVMSFLIWHGAHYLWLALCLVGARVLGATFLAATDAMLADVMPPEDRVEGYSVVRTGGNLGWAAGPALGGFIAEHSYPLVFLFTALTSVLAGLIGWWALRESLASDSRREVDVRDVRLVWQDRSFLALFAGSAIIFMVMGQMIVPLSVYSVEWVGISKQQFGLLCSINGLMVVALQHPLSLRMRNRRHVPLLMTAAALWGIGYLAMGAARSFAWMAVCLAVVTLAEIVYAPTSLSLASRLATPQTRGRYLGTFGLSRVAGWAAAPFVGGLLLGRFAGHPWAVWGTVAALAGVAGSIFHANRERLSLWDDASAKRGSPGEDPAAVEAGVTSP